VDPDFVRSLLLTPTAITLQFQGLRGLGNRTQCGVWYLRVRSCGKISAMSGQTRQADVACAASGALRLGRHITHYAISALAACVAIHNLARLGHQLFYGQNQLFGDEKANLGRPRSLAVQLSVGGSTVCQGRSHVVAQPVGPESVGPEKGLAAR
jgi:hypothetical protein